MTFDRSREEALLSALVEAMDARDVDAFTVAIQEYDSMTRLDAWKTSILVRVKRMIASPYAAAGGAGDEDDLT